MEEIFACVCGLDVHKKVIVACLRRIGEGGRVYKEIRKFQTTTRHLRALREWLKESGVTHVAMESTGVFWKPIYNILEGEIAHVLLANAQHIKNVPGRKTWRTRSGSRSWRSAGSSEGVSFPLVPSERFGISPDTARSSPSSVRR